jgi:hypothetical protein
MNRINYLIISILLLWQTSYSQTNTAGKTSPDIFQIISASTSNQGRVSITQDDKIKELLNRYIETRRKEVKIPGYRIRIFSNSGQTARSKAYSEKNRFTELYPDIVTYIEYEAPNFKVYVGDFRNKPSAFRAYKLISKEFRNAFVVPTKINLPKL